jgi:hypothetical protein
MAINVPVNALLGLPSTKLDLETEIRRLINLHGADEVKKVALSLTKKPKGRKQERDWPILGPQIVPTDAANWLDGKDPIAVRSNRSIAMEFAQAHPGYNNIATFRRIQRKLSKSRQWYWVSYAYSNLADDRPYRDFFRIIDALSKRGDPLWTRIADRELEEKLGLLERYRFSFGDPDESMSVREMRARLDAQSLLDRNISDQLFNSSKGRGIFGGRRPSLLGRYLQTDTSDKIE